MQQGEANVLFADGFASHQKGDVARAQALYRQALALQPDHVDALHLLGLVELGRNNYGEALALIDQAIAIEGNNADLYYNRGVVCDKLQDHAGAISCYAAAIRITPSFFKAFNNMACSFLRMNDFDAALRNFDKAIALRPGYAEAYYNRGNAFRGLKQYDAALRSYDSAIAFKRDHIEAHANRGAVLMELGRHDAARQSFDQVIALRPDHAMAHYNRGVVLGELRQYDAALQSYDRSIALMPDNPEAYYGRGNLLKELDRAEAALQSYGRALALKPDHAEASNNAGIVLIGLRRHDEALRTLDQAIAIDPAYAEAYHNRAYALVELGRHDAAIKDDEAAIALKPDYADAHMGLALCLLQLGRFAEGWAKYEWRWRARLFSSPKRDFAAPLWLGDAPLAGKTILLHAEQGMGDTLQFCRYAKLVSDLGGAVILEVERPLVTLLRHLDGVARIVGKGDDLPPFDTHCPLLSLPLAFKTTVATIPGFSRAITSDAERLAKWRQRLGPRTKPRIGVVWSGRATHMNDHNRSIAMSRFVSILSDDVEWISLQTEVRDADRTIMSSHPWLRHFGDEIRDFSDTAALCDLVDRVITVDTSVAHLAGAMGKPVWILLPYNPDWRWLLERSDSPWYPSATLYRQNRGEDWGAVIARVRADLSRIA